MELSEYQRLAADLFERLQESLDNYEDAIDYDFGYSKLTIRFEGTPGAVYVVNTQQAAFQIWVAGQALAWHFTWNDEQSMWMDQKNDVELISLLETRFTNLTGQRISL